MKYMFLTLNDLSLGLRDLTRSKLPAVSSHAAVKLYGPRLQAKFHEIEAIPGVGGSGEPFAEELAAKDVEHDNHGGAIWYLAEAVQRSPMVSPEAKAAVETARTKFVPRLSELQRSHVDEAATALRNESAIAEMQRELKSVRVPGGATLYDWVTAFVGAGKDLDELLRKRAAVVAPDRSAIGGLRSVTVGLLNRFRAALADELADDEAKLAEVDRAVFAYFDQLETRRATAGSGDGATEPTPPPPPAPTPA